MQGRIRLWMGAVLGLLAAGGLGGLPGGAGARDLSDERGPLPTLEVAPGGATSYRAAVPRFVSVGPPVGDERVATLRDEIERGLKFSSEVLPLPHAAYLASEESPLLADAPLDCEPWRPVSYTHLTLPTICSV